MPDTKATNQNSKPQSKLQLEEIKLAKIKENTKEMLEKKKVAREKMEELKLQIAEQSKAMREEIKQADKKLETNQKAIKAIMAKIKKIKAEGDSALTKDTGAAMAMSFLYSQKPQPEVKEKKKRFGLF